MKRIAIALAATATAISLSSCGAVSDNETATCKVTEKTAASKREGGTDYRIYTSCGTFQVADSLTRGTFRSADTYGSIEEGKTYRLTYHGYRNGFLSMFPNVTEAVEVEK